MILLLFIGDCERKSLFDNFIFNICALIASRSNFLNSKYSIRDFYLSQNKIEKQTNQNKDQNIQ